jgi:hypothetical protein
MKLLRNVNKTLAKVIKTKAKPLPAVLTLLLLGLNGGISYKDSNRQVEVWVKSPPSQEQTQADKH